MKSLFEFFQAYFQLIEFLVVFGVLFPLRMVIGMGGQLMVRMLVLMEFFMNVFEGSFPSIGLSGPLMDLEDGHEGIMLAA